MPQEFRREGKKHLMSFIVDEKATCDAKFTKRRSSLVSGTYYMTNVSVLQDVAILTGHRVLVNVFSLNCSATSHFPKFISPIAGQSLCSIVWIKIIEASTKIVVL